MAGKRPERTYKAGKVQVNVWKNKGEKFDSISYQVSKNYKVGDEWKSTNNFTIQDLADLVILIAQIQRDYRVKIQTPESQHSDGDSQSY